MEFSNGNHLVNYCLKILKNKNVELNTYYKDRILSLSYIYNFYNDLKQNGILNQNEYIENMSGISEVIYLCKNTENLRDIILKMKSIIKQFNQYEAKEKDFKFEYYNIDFLLNKNNLSNIYYPKILNVITINQDVGKAYLIRENDMFPNIKYGIYFLYDKNNQIAYIGKSISDVKFRCFESVRERRLYDFSKIEIRITKSKAEVGVYESYYISKYKPYLNKDLKTDDNITFEIEDIPIGITYVKDYNIFKTFTYDYYTNEKITPEEYFSNNKYILSTTVEAKEKLKQYPFRKKTSIRVNYNEKLSNYKDNLGFYYYEFEN